MSIFRSGASSWRVAATALLLLIFQGGVSEEVAPNPGAKPVAPLAQPQPPLEQNDSSPSVRQPEQSQISQATEDAQVPSQAQPQAEEQTTALPLEEINLFAQVFGKIKSEYVDDVEDRKLLRDAINGILAGLDPHSTFLDAEAFREMRIDTRGEFGGLGIEVTLEKGFVKVVTPIDDTPAFRAGIQPGDIITHIDGETIGGGQGNLSLSEAVKKMRGKPGTETILTIAREGEEAPLEITVVRDVIQLVSVKTRELGEPGYAYMRITNFEQGTADKLARKLNQFKRESGKVDGLVLDLRNNPGGLLSAAVDVSDLFLDEHAGLIVETRGRLSSSRSSFSADSPDILAGAPIVVLVNNGSASASEIVAGALQDHKRAIIFGTQTFGKGSVQTITPIGQEAAIKITTARYYTPNGRSIQETGIQPDILSERVKTVKVDEHGRREVDLAGHLDNDQDSASGTVESNSVHDDDARAFLDSDSQVRDALNLLRGINLARTRGTSQG